MGRKKETNLLTFSKLGLMLIAKASERAWPDKPGLSWKGCKTNPDFPKHLCYVTGKQSFLMKHRDEV